MIKKFAMTTTIVLIIMLGGGTIFMLSKKQINNYRDISQLINKKLNTEITIPPQKNATSTADEIVALQKQIDELKNQPPKIIYRTVMTPASPSPLPDLKTQEELNLAKEQISSLTKELAKTQIQQVQNNNDGNLIKSWQAENKVVQVACEDRLLGAWQLGSGVLIGSDGRLLTNQHVVAPSSGAPTPSYCLVLFNKDFNSQTSTYTKQYRAVIVGFFQSRDAALLKIQDTIAKNSSGVVQSAPINENFSYFETAKSQPQIGDPTYVIGYPESANFYFSVTKGIISNFTSDGLYFGTDAQIDRGNSGGASINSNGQLMGIPTYKFVGNGDYRGYILDINSIKIQ